MGEAIARRREGGGVEVNGVSRHRPEEAELNWWRKWKREEQRGRRSRRASTINIHLVIDVGRSVSTTTAGQRAEGRCARIKRGKRLVWDGWNTTKTE